MLSSSCPPLFLSALHLAVSVQDCLGENIQLNLGLVKPMHWHGMSYISANFNKFRQLGSRRGGLSVIRSFVFSVPFAQLADSSGHMCIDTAFVGSDSCFQRLARIAARHCREQTVPQWRVHTAPFGIQRDALCHLFIRECLYFLLD